MADMKINKALAQLQALRDELPAGDIEEKYVDLYHASLIDIQDEIGQDLSYFRIPPEELKHHVSGRMRAPRIGGRPSTGGGISYSTERYCDRARFLIALKGAINFINSLIQT